MYSKCMNFTIYMALNSWCLFYITGTDSVPSYPFKFCKWAVIGYLFDSLFIC